MYDNFNELMSLPWQIGSFPDHSPPSWHILFSSPSSLYPSMQLYVALDPGFIPSSCTLPLEGADNS